VEKAVSMTAVGTADFWKDWVGVENFGGPGEYEVDGWQVEIYKDKKVKQVQRGSGKKKKIITPQSLSNEAHPSVLKYGFGQMFFGTFHHTQMIHP
jgi:hypothetical protein